MKKIIIGVAGGTSVLLTLATTVYASGSTFRGSDALTAGGAGLASAGFGLASILSCCFPCGIFMLAMCVPLVIGIIVYKDAIKYEVENAILWGIFAGLFNVVGILVYFLAIKPDAIKNNEAKRKAEADKQ